MKTNSERIRRLMAYIVTPLIFMIIGYIIVAIVFSPFFDVIHAAGSMVINPNPEGSNFGQIYLLSTFDEDAADYVDEDEDGVIHVSQIVFPYYGDHYAEIRNRRIGLLAPVYFGDSYEILRVGVGHNLHSRLPGFGGTILMAGHNTHHFLPLQDIEIGDVIELQTNYGHFEYEIFDIDLFHRDTAARYIDFDQMDIEMLIIYTCYPFNSNTIGRAEYRLFVFAEKISGPVVDILARE